MDALGNVFVVDREFAAIHKITPDGTNWVKTTIAGSAPGTGINFGSRDGTNNYAQFNWLYGIAIDSSRDLYVTDGGDGEGNQTIRKIMPVETNWVVSTLAGSTGNSGNSDGVGSSARFDNPAGIAVDSEGNIYVADKNSFTIRKITPGGLVTTLAGKARIGGAIDGAGPNARFFLPIGLAVDTFDNVYVCDTGNNAIRKITIAGVVSTVAKLAVGDSQLWFATGVAVDQKGIIFVSDNLQMTIDRVNPDGTVTTVAGFAGRFGGDDGVGGNARFFSPEGIAVDRLGNVYVADRGYIIRKGVIYNGPPTIATQPHDRTVFAGTNVSLSVSVYGYSLLSRPI